MRDVGELRFPPEMLTAKRPGDGISPMRFWDLLGTAANFDYDSDDKIN